MIKCKFVSRKQAKKNVYRLYRIATPHTDAYLVEINEPSQSALALIQTDVKNAKRLFGEISAAKVCSEQLCDVTEDFRRNALY